MKSKLDFKITHFIKNERVHIFIILAIALSLRLYDFRQGEVLVSSDEVYLFQNSLKPLTFLLNYSFSNYSAELFRFFNFNWGWVTLSFSTVFSFILTLAGIPFTEQTINFPYVLLGTATIYLVYLLGVEFRNVRTGLIAALIFAVYPVHVSTSRSIGLIGIVAAFFFLLTIYLFIRYFKENKYKNTAFFSLGIYFAADFQFYGLLPILVILGFVIGGKKTVFLNFLFVVKKLFSKSAFFFFVPTAPIFLSALYLYSKNFAHNSYLVHIFQKSSYFGLFFFETLYDFYANAGPALFILFAAAAIYSIAKLFSKNADKNNFALLLWLIINLIPWIFIVNRNDTVVYEYVMHPTSALIFLSALFIDELFNFLKSNFLKFIILISVLIPTLIFTFWVVFFVSPLSVDPSVPDDFILSHQDVVVPIFNTTAHIHFGVKGRNTGIKSAGFYLRELSDKNRTIFSDHESFVTQYYTGIEALGNLDTFKDEQIISDFLKLVKYGEIDYVYFEKNHHYLWADILNQKGFSPEVLITDKSKLLGVLYSKNNLKPVSFEVRTVDKLFDKKYGNLQSLFVDYS